MIVDQLCPTLWDPMDCILPGSFVHGILQARILECGLPFQQLFGPLQTKAAQAWYEREHHAGWRGFILFPYVSQVPTTVSGT